MECADRHVTALARRCKGNQASSLVASWACLGRTIPCDGVQALGLALKRQLSGPDASAAAGKSEKGGDMDGRAIEARARASAEGSRGKASTEFEQEVCAHPRSYEPLSVLRLRNLLSSNHQ